MECHSRTVPPLRSHLPRPTPFLSLRQPSTRPLLWARCHMGPLCLCHPTATPLITLSMKDKSADEAVRPIDLVEKRHLPCKLRRSLVSQSCTVSQYPRCNSVLEVADIQPIDYCAKSKLPPPEFCHEIAQGKGDSMHKVWIIIGKQKYELPVQYASLSQGQERVAKKVLEQLHS